MGTATQSATEPVRIVSRHRRALRASGVAAIWMLGALPLAFGRAHCPIAVFLSRPCPGCGMTRAVHLLFAGDLAGSVRMHPLAVPSALASVAFALVTVWATFALGSPLDVYRSRAGRLAIYFFALVNACAIVLWVARWFGAFGGPVPV